MVFYEKIWGKKEARMVRLERKLREGYTMRVCIFRVRSTLLAVISIVYLNFGIFRIEYTLRVCIFFVSHGGFCFSRNARKLLALLVVFLDRMTEEHNFFLLNVNSIAKGSRTVGYRKLPIKFYLFMVH